MVRIHIKACLLSLLYVILFSLSVSLATVVLHEAGHYLTGIAAGCNNIKLVLVDSERGTYTQMNCPTELSIYFPILGSFLITLPFSLCFLLLKGLEKNFFFVSIGFNLVISMLDMPFVFLQPISLFTGLAFIVFGECLLVDKSLFSLEGSL